MVAVVSILDRAIGELDAALRCVAGVHRAARPFPDTGASDAGLSDAERADAAALMRVNHVGEVCAQALYRGQALTSRSETNRAALASAAREEEDHLAWSAQRVREREGRTSLLNPLWYAGSFALGAAAGIAGERWNLAFLAETERQVEEHLGGHLARLSPNDGRTRTVIESMRADEARHRATAIRLGAPEMPSPVTLAMRSLSRVMTTVAYRI